MPEKFSFDELLQGGTAVATPKTANLVNESPSSNRFDFQELLKPAAPPTYDQLHSMEGINQQAEAMQRREALPKTWFGEFWQGAKVGVDQLQQLGYASGAIASDAAGMDKLKDWFLGASRAQDKEIAGEPLNVEDTDEIHGFDSFMRWFSGSVGKAVPQLAESAITGAIGAAAGSELPGLGTAAGGVTGFVERQAISKMVKTAANSLVKDELTGFAEGTIKREALSELAKTELIKDTGSLLKHYGANTAVGLNSWATETASIYDSMKDDPNTSDSQKKTASIFGGLLAAIPDTAFKSYVASKFFPGKPNVPASEVDKAQHFLLRVAKEVGGEMSKALPGGFGEEYAQTLVETAARLYGNPETRNKFLNFTPAQWHEALQAGYQGAAAEGAPVGIIAPIAALKPHPNPKVNENQDAVTARANDLQPAVTPNIGPDDERLSVIAGRIQELETQIAEGTLPAKAMAQAKKELRTLNKEQDKILKKSQEDIYEAATPEAPVTVKKNDTGEMVEVVGAERKGKDLVLATKDGTEIKSKDVSFVNEAEKAAAASTTGTGTKEAPKETPKEESKGKATKVKGTGRKLTPLEQATAYLRALYAPEMPTARAKPIPLDPKGVASKRAEVNATLETLTESARTPAEKKLYKDAVNEIFTDDFLNFLFHENIDVRKATKQDIENKVDGFAVVNYGEKIVMVLPDISTIVREGRQAIWATKDEPASIQKYFESLPDILSHEVAHAFDFTAMRDQWRKEKAAGSKQSYSEYITERVTARGAALRNAWSSLPKEAFTSYSFGKIGEMDDEQLGDEFMRMMVQAIRTGTIDEVTQALARASIHETGEMKGKVGPALKEWVKALRGLYQKMLQYFSSDLASPEFLQDFHNIVQTLDHYNVLVNEGEERKAKTPEAVAKEEAVAQEKTKAKEEAAAKKKAEAEAAAKKKEEEAAAKKAEAEAAAKTKEEVKKEPTLYHVTTAKNLTKIQKEGIKRFQTSNWAKGMGGKRYGKGEVYAFENFDDAVRWAAKMDWEFNKTIGSGNIKIVELKKTGEWAVDKNDPLSQAGQKGKWMKSTAAIPSDQIVRSVTFDKELAQRLKEKEITAPVSKAPAVQTLVNLPAMPGRTMTDAEAKAGMDAAIKKAKERGTVVRGITAYLKYTSELGIPPNFKDFKELWKGAKGLTQKLFNTVLAGRRAYEERQKALEAIVNEEPTPEPTKELEEAGGRVSRKAIAEPKPEWFDRSNEGAVRTSFHNILNRGYDARAVLEAWRENSKADAEGRGEMFDEAEAQLTEGMTPEEVLRNLAESMGMTSLEEKGDIIKFDPETHEDTEGGLLKGDKAIVIHPGLEFSDKVVVRAQTVPYTGKGRVSYKASPRKFWLDRSGEMIEVDLKSSHAAKAAEILGKAPPPEGGDPNILVDAEKELLDKGYVRAARTDPVLYVQSNNRPTNAQLKTLKEIGDYHGIVVEWDHPSGRQIVLHEPVGRRSFASKPSIRKDDMPTVNQEVIFVNENNQVKFNVKPKQRKDRGGKVFWEGIPAEMLKYDSVTETEAAKAAQDAIDKFGGALEVGERLIDDRVGKFLGFEEDDPNSFLPGAKVFATYANVVSQLTHIMKGIKGNVRDDTYAYIQDIWAKLAISLAASTTAAAQSSQIGQSGMQIRDGLSAKMTYVDVLLDNAKHVLGEDAREAFTALTKNLNEIMEKGSPLASVAPKVISYIREIDKTVDKARFAKGVRQTVVRNLEALMKVVQKAAARAANHMAESEINPEKMERMARQMIKEFDGVPQKKKGRTTEQIFESTVKQFMRIVGKREGLVGAVKKAPKPTVSNAMAIMLRNRDAYEQFTSMFMAGYVREYGSDPSESFLQEVSRVHAAILEMFDGRALQRSLVNEKMMQFKYKFSEIVKGYYDKGEFETAVIKAQITKEMKEQGVEDEALMKQLADDIEEEMLKRISEARQKFYGSAKGIKQVLKYMGTNLAEVSSDLLKHADKLEGQLRDALIRNLGFPDTPELPLATTMATIMQAELNRLVESEQKKYIEQWREKALNGLRNPTHERKVNLNKAIDSVLKMTKAGVMRDEVLYKELATFFKELPKYSEETMAKMEKIGEHIYNSQFPRQFNAIKQDLADILASAQPFSTDQVKTAAMYVSFLSGPSTIVGANPFGNLAQLTMFTAENMLKSLTRPHLMIQMFRAMFNAASTKAFWELRETLYTGMEQGKAGNKYSAIRSPFELKDIFFQSKYTHPWAVKADMMLTKLAYNLARYAGGGKWVMRALMATDIFFGKIAEEAAFTMKTGQYMWSEKMWLSAMDKAREEMLKIGQNPDEGGRNHSRLMVLANSIYENARLHDKDGNLVNDKAIAWLESNNESLRVTLNQEPRGMMGGMHRAIQKLSNEFPLLRLFVPFTRIAANSVNMALEYTPAGYFMMFMPSFYKETKGLATIDQTTGAVTRTGTIKSIDGDIALRASIGTLAIFTLASMMGTQSDDPDDEPFFWIYGNGPKDKAMRSMLYDRGWKPNTVKVGGAYYNYLLTPLAMAFSIIGYHGDRHLDGTLPTLGAKDISLVSSGVALLDAVANQSFLATMSDFMSAVNSPDPESKLNRIVARTSSVVVPSWMKQLDKFVDPSMQEAKGFTDVMFSQYPFARKTLKPYLNYFGQPVTKSNGMLPFPGMQVLATAQRSDDPVIRFLTDNSLEPSGYSKSTRLGNQRMTDDQRYEYIQLAGPQIHQRIQAELSELATMDHQQKQDRIREIAESEKAKARNILKQKYAP